MQGNATTQLTYRFVNYAYAAAQLEASCQPNSESPELTHRSVNAHSTTASAARSMGFPLKYRGVAYSS
jgi:hypothetical protein